MDDALHLLKAAAKALLRRRGLTLVTVLTLALGVGGGTATFEILKALSLRALTYHEADRLVVLWATEESQEGAKIQVSPADYDVWRQQTTVFESLAAYMFWGFTMTGQGEPQALTVAAVRPSLFSTLRVDAEHGRTFTAEEAVVGRGDVVVLGYRFWQGAFGGDTAVVGRSITLDGDPHVVIGVMPRGFRFPHETIDLWVPLALDPHGAGYRRPALRVVGRLSEGVDLEAARQAMTRVARRLERQSPETNRGRGVAVTTLYEQTYGRLQPVLLSVAAAVLSVFLIACTNVANLLLARDAARREELAVRRALGAGRLRLVGESLAESLWLAAVGGGLGLPVAYGALHLVAGLWAGEGPWLGPPALSASTLGVAFLLTLGTVSLFGILPALRAARSAQAAVPSGALPGRAPRHRRWGTAMLIVLEMGVALFLLAGSGLVLLSLKRLENTPKGFDGDGLATFRVQLPSTRYPSQRHLADFWERLQGRLDALPGVDAVAVTSALPMSPALRDFELPFAIEGRPDIEELKLQAHIRIVSPDFFRVLGIPVISGRSFEDRDIRDETRQAIVNHTLAKRFWPGDDPVGKSITVPFRGVHSYRIVGVVGDVRFRGPAQAPTPEIYWPLGQVASPNMALVLSAVPGLEAAAKVQLWDLDAGLPLRGFEPLDRLLHRSLAGRRFQGRVLLVLASLALALAAVGVFGVMSLLVGRRTREIAVRIAVGARPHRILSEVVGRAVGLSLLGMSLGAVVVLLVTTAALRLWPDQLFGVAPHDPWVLGGSAALLGLVALGGSLQPALRAAKTDPSRVLKLE